MIAFVRNPFAPRQPLPAGKRFMLQAARPVFRPPTGADARAILTDHLARNYKAADGGTVCWWTFRRRFIRSITPPQQMWWAQHDRIRRVLADLDVLVSVWQAGRDGGSMVVANIVESDRGSYAAPRRLIQEYENGAFLVPEDLSA